MVEQIPEHTDLNGFDTRPGESVGNHHHPVFLGELHPRQHNAGGVGQGFFRVAAEVDAVAEYVAVEGELAPGAAVVGKGADNGRLGVAVGDQVGHQAAPCWHNDGAGVDGFRQFDGGGGNLLLVTAVFEAVAKAQAAAVFRGAGNFVEHFHAFNRVFANGGFSRQHNGVGFFVNGIGDVG